MSLKYSPVKKFINLVGFRGWGSWCVCYGLFHNLFFSNHFSLSLLKFSLGMDGITSWLFKREFGIKSTKGLIHEESLLCCCGKKWEGAHGQPVQLDAKKSRLQASESMSL